MCAFGVMQLQTLPCSSVHGLVIEFQHKYTPKPSSTTNSTFYSPTLCPALTDPNTASASAAVTSRQAVLPKSLQPALGFVVCRFVQHRRIKGYGRGEGESVGGGWGAGLPPSRGD